jgi:xanthine dehydrogenase accessory factor
VKDILPTLERWLGDGLRAVTATVVKTERSAPRQPGAVLAVSEQGEVAGSVTGGCVEPAVYDEAQEVLAGGLPRLVTYGIADEDAFDVGLPCGGTVHIFLSPADPRLVGQVAAAVREERSIALATDVGGPHLGEQQLVGLEGPENGELASVVRDVLARGESTLVAAGERELFVASFAPRPRMYVFGAVDHAAAVASIGRFLGYRVTVCDARAKFATAERFPEVDELVVDWPDRFLAKAHVDERSAIVVLTHDHRFDVPLLRVALDTPARYVGAMGARRTNAERSEKLLAEGVSEEKLARIHAPIGLDIGSRTPEEVAVSIAAELIAVSRANGLKGTWKPPAS